MILVFLVILMLFGSKSIPDIARTLGKASRQFKDATSAIQRDIEAGARDFKSQVEKETRVISDQATDISRQLSEDDLAGSSTPAIPYNPQVTVEPPVEVKEDVDPLPEVKLEGEEPFLPSSKPPLNSSLNSKTPNSQ